MSERLGPFYVVVLLAVIVIASLTSLFAARGIVQRPVGCAGYTPVDFHSIPVNFTAMPVFVMTPGSTGTVCVTYKAGWADNSTLFKYNSDEFKNSSFHFPTPISKTTSCTFSEQEAGCTSVYSHSFVVFASPDAIRPTASVGYVTIIYTITALPNATGFYDHSFVWACEDPRVAVGESNFNGDAFAPVFYHSCPNLIYNVYSIGVKGMDVSYVNLRTLDWPSCLPGCEAYSFG